MASEGSRHQYAHNRVGEMDAWTDQEQKARMISFSYPPRRIRKSVCEEFADIACTYMLGNINKMNTKTETIIAIKLYIHT